MGRVASHAPRHLLRRAAAADEWSLRCFVNNVTDVRHVVSGDSNYGIGFHEAEYNRPRDWGVAGKISSF